MDIKTVRSLIEINFQFYQTFAHHFSTTRKRLQPGVQRIIDQMPDELNVIDLGCGNGELGHSLARGGRRGVYVGLDSSSAMLKIAAKQSKVLKVKAGESESKEFKVIFLQADLSQPNWYKEVPNLPYDFALAFAVLHHLPGYTLRLKTLCQVHEILKPGGYFIHSEWQFLNSPRLHARVLPWETVGLTENQVDTGDYLLDWKQGGYGLRYVHHFNESELAQLALKSGFKINQNFLSDGEGSKLGLYQIWQVNSDKIN